jgi:hypothetical protein
MAKTWTAQTIEIDNHVEAVGASKFGRLFRISLATWANGLRLIDEAGTPLRDVRRLAGADCNVGGLERWGWITVDAHEDAVSGRRSGYGSGRGLRADTVLRPTRAGIAARKIWRAAIHTAESRWRERFGSEFVDGLRCELEALSIGMPWAPPQVSAAGGFRTHLVDSESVPEEPDRPLVVLLGQALTALTRRAEEDASVSLPLGENLLWNLDDCSVPIKELPSKTGLSKEAIAMAVGFAVRSDLASIESGLVTLTAKGAEALADRRSRATDIAGTDALRVDLESVLSQPHAIAAGLEPPPGCWRGERPYVAQTQRLLANPVAALPRHPMVLHRGGWPDGS